MPFDSEKKRQIIVKYRLHEGDTGSPEVQIAILTERIKSLSGHFELHKKDHTSRRGLLQLVGQRRRFLNYLKKQDPMRYKKVLDEMGLRR